MEVTDPIVLESSKFYKYPSVLFGFSTRKGGVSPEPYGLNMSFHVGDDPMRVSENRRLFLQKLQIGLDELAIPVQCHGNTVRRVLRPGTYENCDALVTSERRVFLSVSVADCIPLFLYDPVKITVSAVHVGWRGCSNGIIKKTVNVLIGEFNARPEDLVAYLGPSARSCCYEVGEDVAKNFPREFLKLKDDGKFLLDLQASTRAQLVEAGVVDEMIEDCGRCTICSPGSVSLLST